MEPTKVHVNDTIKVDGKKTVVKAPCESKNGGHWYCVTHQAPFATQLSKDMHLKDRCRLAWMCHEHGIEQP